MASFVDTEQPMDIEDPIVGIKNAILNGGVTDYIKRLETKDIDNIFNNTKKTPAGHIEFFTGQEWPTLNVAQKRRTYAASTLIIAKYSTCDIEEVKSYLKSFDHAHRTYIKTYIGYDSLDQLIDGLNGMALGGGRKKQTGGGFAEIAQLLAGLDVVALKLINQRGMDVEIIKKSINGTIMLLDNAAIAISALSGLPACMKSLLGDTLYRLMHRLATSIIGYKITAFSWENKMALIRILGKILSYTPAVASGAIALIIGFVATKVIESAAAAATAVEYEDNLKAALDALDGATVEQISKIGMTGVTNAVDLSKKFIGLSVELVIKVRTDLAAAGAAVAAQNVIENSAFESKIRADWDALLVKANVGIKRVRDEESEKDRLNNLFTEKFAAIQDAIRMSPEYIAAAARTAAEIADAEIAEETMARELEAGAEEAAGAMDHDEEVGDDAGAKKENQGAMDTAMGPDAKANEGAGAGQVAKKYRGEERAEGYEGYENLGGKRKSQKQKKQQKQQKKTQKQSQKKLSKSKRAKKAKQSKKANKKH
jgi:hypothetical protein